MIARIAATAAATLLLAGCAQTVNGTPLAPTGAAGLFERITAAAQSLTSLHIEMREQLAGADIEAVGDEQLTRGKMTALQLDEQLSGFGGDIRVVIVGSHTYARIPPLINTSDKPWVLVRTGSSNPFASAMAQGMGTLKGLDGFTAMSAYVQAATGFHVKGSARVDGVATTHYALTVDVGRLPDSFPLKAALKKNGLSSIPVELWVDADGKVRKAHEIVDTGSQKGSTDVNLSGFNQPVHITAPPRAQVDTS